VAMYLIDDKQRRSSFDMISKEEARLKHALYVACGSRMLLR
jgi:hypothetical protein